MKYLKIYENFDSFYSKIMYGILIEIGSEFGDESEVIELGKKLIKLFTDKGINFRTYYERNCKIHSSRKAKALEFIEHF